MTQTLGVNASNDLYRGTNGNLVVLLGDAAILAACASAARARLGEMVLMTALGMPFFQAAFSGIRNVPAYEGYLRRTLQAVVGVVSIPSLQVQVNRVLNGTTGLYENVLSYIAKIKTINGTTISLSG